MATTHIDYNQKPTPSKYKVFDNEVYEYKLITHFKVFDFSHLYIIQFTEEWFASDEGQWITHHCKDIDFFKSHIPYTFYMTQNITAYIKPSDYTFYKVKFST